NDAVPYFRIFNPELQTKRFDPELKYIRKWVPEIDDPFSYPKPIIDHKFARERAINTYKIALRT
ncbi:MAG TPA: FAD-binding domain-containing protein, partial [Sphingobacteriaceae bacterium]